MTNNMQNMRFAIQRLNEVEANIKVLKAEALILKSQVAALAQSFETPASAPEDNVDKMSKESYDRVLSSALERLEEVEKKL